MSDIIDARVRSILVEHLGITEDEVTPGSRLVPVNDGRGNVVASDVPDLGCDSLDVVELTMTLEEEFGIEIGDEEAEPLHEGTVQDVCELVNRKVAALGQ